MAFDWYLLFSCGGLQRLWRGHWVVDFTCSKRPSRCQHGCYESVRRNNPSHRLSPIAIALAFPIRYDVYFARQYTQFFTTRFVAKSGAEGLVRGNQQPDVAGML